MNDSHATMLYARLAALSAQRRQLPGRDRFLILAGIAATRTGWSQVADRCHQLVTAGSPRHLLCRYASFAEALADPAFDAFARRLNRMCTPELAEHLLAEAGLSETIEEFSQATALRVLPSRDDA